MNTTSQLPVMEHFYTIQGEGSFAGKAAYFVRLGGCDVGCTWCDVKESWPMEGHKMMEISEIITEINQTNAKIVVITGGEPLMHNLDELTKQLKLQNLRTHIETSGAHTFSGIWDWITLSPKKFKMPLAESYSLANELKIIAFNNSDIKFAIQESDKINTKKCNYYLQAEWTKRETMYPIMVEFVKEKPEWQISVQTHKYMNIP